VSPAPRSVLCRLTRSHGHPSMQVDVGLGERVGDRDYRRRRCGVLLRLPAVARDFQGLR
jgi:hypothetical protein